MQRRHTLIIKRHFATHEHIQDDPKTPHVHFGTSVRFRVEEFGSGKVETAAKSGEERSGSVEVGETKVDDFNVARFGDEDVFDFEICTEERL